MINATGPPHQLEVNTMSSPTYANVVSCPVCYLGLVCVVVTLVVNVGQLLNAFSSFE